MKKIFAILATVIVMAMAASCGPRAPKAVEAEVSVEAADSLSAAADSLTVGVDSLVVE